jgi:hypothetical protein
MSLFQMSNYNIPTDFDKMKRYFLKLSPNQRKSMLEEFMNNNISSEYGLNNDKIIANNQFKDAIYKTLESLEVVAKISKYWPAIKSAYLQQSAEEQSSIAENARMGTLNDSFWQTINMDLQNISSYTLATEYLYYVLKTITTNNINTARDFVSNFPLQKVVLDGERLETMLVNLSTYNKDKLFSIMNDLYSLNRNAFIKLGFNEKETTSIIGDLKNMDVLTKLRQTVEEELAKHLYYDYEGKIKRKFTEMNKEQQKMFLMNVDNVDEWDKVNAGSISSTYFESHPYIKKYFVDEIQKLYGENIVQTNKYIPVNDGYMSETSEFILNDNNYEQGHPQENQGIETNAKPKSAFHRVIGSTKKIFKNPFKKTGGKKRRTKRKTHKNKKRRTKKRNIR